MILVGNRKVVWQGSAGDRRPHADLTAHSEITSVWATMQNLRDFGLHKGVCICRVLVGTLAPNVKY
jgi:hypothetical protein